MATRSLRAVVSHVARFPAVGRAFVVFRASRRYLNVDTVTSSPPTAPLPRDQEVDRTFPAIDWAVSRDTLVRAKTGARKTAQIILAVESRLGYIKQRAELAVASVGLESSLPDTGRIRLTDRSHFVGPLILAPTRESAIQIASDAQRLATRQEGFEVVLLVGGGDRARQKKDWMESSRDLVVATPGRLRDLLTNEPEFRQAFKGCPMLVLDETDTLLSMGFRDDIDAIASFLPRPPFRQTLLFSATIPRAVRQLASWILSRDHRFIDATLPGPALTPFRNNEHLVHPKPAVPCDDGLPAHHPVEQFHISCPAASDQLPTLLKLLAHDQLIHGSCSKVVVFCPTDQMAELFAALLDSLVAEALPDSNTEVVKIHLRMRQSERYQTRVLLRTAGGVERGRPTVLVTSDISARGADYPGTTRTIQIGIPSTESLHIHRMERMARVVNSFISRKGKEKDDRPTVRADMLLLPWEAGYLDWQLTSLPMKALPVPVLDTQLASLSARTPTLTTEFLSSALARIRHRIDPADVRSTAASLLGYYLPLTPSLRLQPRAILAGVSSWASECFHVSIPATKRFPRKFTEAYEQSIQPKTKGLFADRLRLAAPSSLGKSKSKNQSVWEGANTQRWKPKRWY